MRSSASVTLCFLLFASAAVASASDIDMDDPRRALGRKNDIRVDAQLLHDTVSPGMAIAITYQIQNFTNAPVAIADKLASASYDLDTRVITLSIGSETPQDNMPHMTTVEPGEKKVLRASAVPTLTPAATRTASFATPRYVQVKISLLREMAPFRALIANQSRRLQPIPAELFDAWFECNETILLNVLPIRFALGRDRLIDAERRGARGM